MEFLIFRYQRNLYFWKLLFVSFLTCLFVLKESFPNLWSILVSRMVCLANFFKQVHIPLAFTLLYTLLESYDKDLMTKNIEGFKSSIPLYI